MFLLQTCNRLALFPGLLQWPGSFGSYWLWKVHICPLLNIELAQVLTIWISKQICNYARNYDWTPGNDQKLGVTILTNQEFSQLMNLSAVDCQLKSFAFGCLFHIHLCTQHCNLGKQAFSTITAKCLKIISSQWTVCTPNLMDHNHQAANESWAFTLHWSIWSRLNFSER